MPRAEPTPPNDNATEFGEIVYVARADRVSKMIFLLGGGFSLGTAGVIWPEFSQRFGSLAGWALTLWYNPLFAAPGLIVVVAAAAGIWCLLWFLFYVRVRVEVRRHGIRISPGRSRARWDEVHEIYYARRRLRNTPERESLQLRTPGGKKINLPHRFQDMDELLSKVRERVEPLLLDRATRPTNAARSSVYCHLMFTHPSGTRPEEKVPLAYSTPADARALRSAAGWIARSVGDGVVPLAVPFVWRDREYASRCPPVWSSQKMRHDVERESVDPVRAYRSSLSVGAGRPGLPDPKAGAMLAGAAGK